MAEEKERKLASSPGAPEVSRQELCLAPACPAWLFSPCDAAAGDGDRPDDRDRPETTPAAAANQTWLASRCGAKALAVEPGLRGEVAVSMLVAAREILYSICTPSPRGAWTELDLRKILAQGAGRYGPLCPQVLVLSRACSGLPLALNDAMSLYADVLAPSGAALVRLGPTRLAPSTPSSSFLAHPRSFDHVRSAGSRAAAGGKRTGTWTLCAVFPPSSSLYRTAAVSCMLGVHVPCLAPGVAPQRRGGAQPATQGAVDAGGAAGLVDDFFAFPAGDGKAQELLGVDVKMAVGERWARARARSSTEARTGAEL